MPDKKIEKGIVVKVINPPTEEHIKIKLKELSKFLSKMMSKQR